MADTNYSPDRAKLYHYKLDRILGKGGTGTVYRGIDTKKGEVVALKRFNENFFRNPLHIRDMKKSVKKYRKFDHPNVMKLDSFLNSSEEDGNCMVMEYIDGADLNWYIRNRNYLLPERIGIATQLCNGLQYLHDQSCVHHDFKPSNVIFTRKGQAKIADYSLYGGSVLAEVLGGVAEQVTPLFVAPEFILKEKITSKADQYSLGITLYLLFTEKIPFRADNLQALYQAHIRSMPEHPHTANPVCSPQLGDIIMKLLQKNPDHRFDSCDLVRIALSNIGRSRI